MNYHLKDCVSQILLFIRFEKV